MRRPAVLPAILLAAVSALAGCGSTVSQELRTDLSYPQAGSAASDAAAALGTAADVDAGLSTPVDTPADNVPADRDLAVGGVPQSTEQAPTTGSAGAAPPTRGGVGTGATPSATTLEVGLMYSEDTGAALKAMGANAGSGSDLRDMQRAVIDHVNRNGGVAGRKLIPRFHNVSATDNPSEISQKACAAWTEDADVFAAVPLASVQDNALMRDCLGRAGVLAIYPNFYGTTRDRDFEGAPLWFETSSLSLEQAAQHYVEGLAAQGFFKGARVGLVYDESPGYRDVVARVLKPALRRVGGELVAEATSRIHGVNDLSSGQSSMSGAVLQFRSKDVTHVLFFEQWVGYFLFMQNAENQGWRPTYGASTGMAPQIVLELGLAPKGQFNGAYIASWNPFVDVAEPHPQKWPRLQLCEQIYRKASITYTGSQATHGALAICQSLLLLAEGAAKAPAPLTPRSMQLGLERISTGLQLAVLPRARFGPQRHYGAALVRPGRFDAACSCFRYTGPGRDV